MTPPAHTTHLLPGSPSWPRELDTIASPPAELWARGRLELLRSEPARRIALVGSRAPTPYGEEQAGLFARHLARLGVTVVSGLARGIDQAAHAGALEVGGGTLAVLGSGVDRPWPGGAVARRIEAEGLLLSEFPPGLGPRRHHFPLRNRLIAGLSAAVLVVEAGRVSGSLITAHWAADQGRTVFALPGRVDHPMAAGCHRLIREGATLVESPEELLDELGWVDAGAREDTPGPESATPLLAALRGETLSGDELAERLGRPASEVLVELVEHELAGRVARAPGGLWRLLERR